MGCETRPHDCERNELESIELSAVCLAVSLLLTVCLPSLPCHASRLNPTHRRRLPYELSRHAALGLAHAAPTTTSPCICICSRLPVIIKVQPHSRDPSSASFERGPGGEGRQVQTC